MASCLRFCCCCGLVDTTLAAWLVLCKRVSVQTRYRWKELRKLRPTDTEKARTNREAVACFLSEPWRVHSRSV